jgi:TolB-like protein/Tfp pilus assembly protein PilF
MISLRELRERKVGQWTIGYVAGAWIVLQVAALLNDTYGWPDVVMRVFPVLLAAGLLATVVLAWYHGDRGNQRVTRGESALLAGILVLAAGASVLVSMGAGSGAQVLALAPAVETGAEVAEQGSIAVLPFADMSPGRDQEYFSDGITEELLNVLAQLPELRVASRTSAFSFKDKGIAVDSIARALRVRHVLEGSVRKAGERVRITAQLIDAATGYHLWSETYDRDLRDVFAVQDEISREIVRQLQITLAGGRGGAVLAKKETDDPEAHALVLRGIHIYRMDTHAGYEQAETLLKQAIARDPDYARAYAALAGVYSSQAYRRHGPVEALTRKAQDALDRALQLDPDLADAHHFAGALALDRGDLHAAQASIGRAVELNPGYAPAQSMRAWLLASLGRHAEAIAAAERAAALDPVSASIQNNLGGVYNYARQYERADRAYQASSALDPGNPTVMANMALNYIDLGRHADAIRTAEEARVRGPEEQFNLAVLAYVYARGGRRGEAADALRRLEAQPEPSHYLLATVYAGLGERERVFSLLERAVTGREELVLGLGVDSAFDAYRSDPRMRRLLERLGLPVDKR